MSTTFKDINPQFCLQKWWPGIVPGDLKFVNVESLSTLNLNFCDQKRYYFSVTEFS